MSTLPDIRLASTVILLREEAGTMQVLMVRRNQQIDFMSGAMVFPGGKLETDDLDPAWRDLVHGWAEVPEIERAARIAAAREVFEEAGLLMVHGEDPFISQETDEARKAIESGTLKFADFVRHQGVRIDITAFTLFSRWLTPPVVPKRFDTFFYLAALPTGQVAVSDGRETVETEWIAPDQALDLAAKGARTIVFPTRMNLKLLSAARTPGEAVAAALLREARTVIPAVESRDGRRYLRLTPDLGYGDIEEQLATS